MAVICNKCKNRTALVSGTFYFDADPEPYESGEEIELNLDGEQEIHGHYCEECKSFVTLWDESDVEQYSNLQQSNKELVEMLERVEPLLRERHLYATAADVRGLLSKHTTHDKGKEETR